MNPTSLRPSRILLAILLALPCVALQAEDTKPTPKPARPEPSDIITIDFPGGPLSKLAAKLNEAGDAKLSIVQAPGLDPVLPAFSVRNVRVMGVIAALGNILESQGFRLNPTDHNLAVLSRIEEREPVTQFASFQLDRKLARGDAADEVVAAIQQGCEFANSGRASTLRFKYHAGTKLLFVSGTPQEVDIAYKVFSSLPDRGIGQPTPPPEKK